MDDRAVNSLERQRAQATNAVGYGIVCGLTFPLMISSTFLQEISLSHGAGDAFGALFFLAYSLTMALTALVHLFHRTPTHRGRMASAYVAAFVGNTLMLGRTLGLIEGGWLYAFLASGTIGYGLATAELGWMARITTLHEHGRISLTRTVPLAFLCGGMVAALIFYATGATEILFALTIIVISAAPLVRSQTLEEADRRISFSQGGAGDFVKAVSYLAVFSFVFGAVSQVATKTGSDPIPIEAQAVVGILVAAAAMLAYAMLRRRPLAVNDLYNVLFPIVALALVALPFITSPALHMAATVLVFTAFYLAGMNVRIAVCLLGERDRVSMWVYLSIALGASGLLILAGVLMGAFVLAQESPAMGLALVSLVSLFVLALNPVVTARLEQRRARDAEAAAPSSAAPDVQPEHADVLALQTDLLRSFAASHGMTARETDVLVLLGQGRTRTYIAAELGLSPNTIKGYIHNVYQKSGAVDKQDLLDRVELYGQGREL
ncbi:helix-turn-helix transcriptional regulator [Arabiibacter massiliensis]|uniref:helix-turn-helix transcriptional regulator n=1 Tax=Arabiibacter massiliensis TaxID=1870985 RepID=UPI000B4257FA|nr:helix-turn-helix transcriptional regulator [Arabiibacter massiliensis]